jgi:diphosphomevalonate decarboxylase
MPNTTTALAHPNIALIKYWGKQGKQGNLPATPNLSITLSNLTTTTSIQEHEKDEFHLNGKQLKDSKIERWLSTMRSAFEVPQLIIKTDNNFPTSAGLASSASGFAALITAINTHCNLGLDQETRSIWARQGSASAARSIHGGFVALVPPYWGAIGLAPAAHWPLEVVVAITSRDQKAVKSTTGMQRSEQTSPFYDAWLGGAIDDYGTAAKAIEMRDFNQLAGVAELNCLKMHSLMLTSIPTLSYWKPASLACMDCIRELRDQGHEVFFTIDAGPQIKAICSKKSRQAVSAALAKVPGVLEIINCTLGEGARILEQ